MSSCDIRYQGASATGHHWDVNGKHQIPPETTLFFDLFKAVQGWYKVSKPKPWSRLGWRNWEQHIRKAELMLLELLEWSKTDMGQNDSPLKSDGLIPNCQFCGPPLASLRACRGTSQKSPLLVVDAQDAPQRLSSCQCQGDPEWTKKQRLRRLSQCVNWIPFGTFAQTSMSSWSFKLQAFSILKHQHRMKWWFEINVALFCSTCFVPAPAAVVEASKFGRH
jgi:hypothetical protein